MKEFVPTSRAKNPEPDTSDIAEWLEGESREVRALFNQLPRPLWRRHYQAIEDRIAASPDLNPEALAQEKLGYLLGVVEARRVSLEEFKSTDPHFRELIAEPKFGERLQGLLESPEETLGAGQTARVKRLSLAGERNAAVKYLLTPTQKTLSAEGEHDMLWEVDTVTHIEEEEHKIGAGSRIRSYVKFRVGQNTQKSLRYRALLPVLNANIQTLV